MGGTLASGSAESTPADLHFAVQEDGRQRDRDRLRDDGGDQLAEHRNDVGGDTSSDQEDGRRGDRAVFADVVRLAPGWLDVAVLVGQLTCDTLPQTVEMTHELG